MSIDLVDNCGASWTRLGKARYEYLRGLAFFGIGALRPSRRDHRWSERAN